MLGLNNRREQLLNGFSNCFTSSFATFDEVVAAFKNINTVFNGTYLGKTVTANVTVVVVDNKPTYSFCPGENFFEVTTSGETKVNIDKTNGVINILSHYTKTTVPHEWGHLFGLVDRYVQSFYYTDDSEHEINFSQDARNTVPISNIPDPDYNPYNNLYSSSAQGKVITEQQYAIMFGDKKESSYTSTIILRKGTKDENANKVIRVSADGTHLTSFPNYASSKNTRAKGREEIQATPLGNTSTCEPYNCEHGSRNKKATMLFFLKQ